MTEPEHFVFLLVEDYTHLAFSCAVEPLRLANFASGRTLYRWSLMSADGRTARASNGTVTLVDRGLTPLERGERLIVVSGQNVQSHVGAALMAYLRRERSRGTSIGAICSGAYILARLGMLDGRQAAIHWAYHDVLAEEFPQVRLQPTVFVADEKYITASGGTAATDLMLHLIGQDHGPDLATAVADQMVYNAVRESSATQRVSLQSRFGTRNAHLVGAIALMEENIEDPMSTGDIAARLGISTRQLERVFAKYTGMSPKHYMMEMRLHRARNFLVQTEKSISEIAMACGFQSTSHFSKRFRSLYGTSPIAQRNRLN